MSDVKRLLEAVEPGPWWHDGAGVIYGNDGDEVASGNGSAAHLIDQSDRAALIVYAVNHLRDLHAMVKWIVQETDGKDRTWDHACLDCTGRTAIVIDGFVCAVHRARRLRGDA